MDKITLFWLIYLPCLALLSGFMIWRKIKNDREIRAENALLKQKADSEDPPEPKKYENNSHWNIPPHIG